MKPCPQLAWAHYRGSPVVTYWEGVEAPANGTSYSRKWFLFWHAGVQRWSVVSMNSSCLYPAAFAETVAEGKEIASAMHEEQWEKWFSESRALRLVNQLVEDTKKELAYCVYAKKRGAPETEWRQVKRLAPGERWRQKALAIADRYRRTDPAQVYRIGPPPLKP